MHPNSELYFQSALELGLPAENRNEFYGFQLKFGKHLYFFRGGFTPFNNGSANNVTDNKFCANKLLELKGLPVPKATGITRKEFENGLWDMDGLTFPVVAKPTTGTCCGKDVLCNIQDMKTLKSYMKNKFKKYNCISIEEFHNNLTAYRILVFFNKVIGVTKRIPAQVIGDGKHTILELIEIENVERKRFNGTVTFGDLKIDEEYQIRLDELRLTPNDTPPEGETIKLCYNCNSTRGGTMISLGNQICKENAKLFCKAAKALDLNLVGFDILCEDINIPIKNSRGVIIEANYHPDITIHEIPTEGEQNHVSKIMMKKFIYKHPFFYLRNHFKKTLRRLFPADYFGY